MAKCNIEIEVFNKEVSKKEVYYKLDDKMQDIIDKQISSVTTLEQKKIADALVREHSKFVGVNESNYIDSEGRPYIRTTQFMKGLRDGYYAFDNKEYDESDYSQSRDAGNTVDLAFEGLFAGKSDTQILEDINALNNGINLNKKAFQKLKAKVAGIKKLYPGAIFIPQLTLGSSVGIAGSLDLTVIKPDGNVVILDLKTSLEPITREWTKKTVAGNYRQYYNKVYTLKNGDRKASTKQKHAAQLTTYKAFIEEATGVEADLVIVPIQLELDSNQDIESLKLESHFEHEEDSSLKNAILESASREEVLDNVKDLSNTDLLQEVLEILEAEARELNKKGSYEQKRKLDDIIENIQMGRTATKISEFIEYMFDAFVGSKNSLNNRFFEYIKNLNLEESDHTEVLQDLARYESEIDLFRGIINEVQGLYDNLKLEGLDTKEDKSNVKKMNQIVATFNEIERLSKDKILPTVARILDKHLPKEKSLKGLEESISNIKKRLNNPKLSEKGKIKLLNKLKSLENTYNQNYDTLLEALRTGEYKDISFLSYKLNPAISLGSSIIATFAKTLKENFEKARIKLFHLEKVAYKAYEDFANYNKKRGIGKANVSKFNEDFIEVLTDRNGNKYYSLVQELNYEAFKSKMDILYIESEEKAKEAKRTQKKYRQSSVKQLTTFFARQQAIELGYIVARSKEDEYIQNPYTGDKVLLHEGLDTIKRKAKESKTDEGYKAWYSINFTKNAAGEELAIGKEVTLPNKKMFTNSKYAEIVKTPEKKKYYDFLISTYFDAQKKIEGRRMLYKLPGIEKNSNDKLREDGGLSWAKRFIDRATDYYVEEKESYGSNKKEIPHMYSQILPMENTSLDLIGSILRYTAAAEKYAVQTRLAPVGNALLNQVKEVGPKYSSDIKLGKIKIGGKSISEYFRKYDKNNTAALLEAMIDMHIYGKHRVKEELGGVKWNKVTDALMGFASFTQIGGKPVLAVANSLAAQVSTAIDAFAGEHLSAKSWGWAKLEYNKYEADFIKDMASPIKKSFIGQLTEIYDALQGEYMDQYGRKISHPTAKKLWSSSTWFAGMHKGEHRAQVQVMLAILKDTKIEDINGKEISLYDAYEMGENGIIKIKDTVDTDLVNFRIMNKIHSLNKKANGIYNSFDKPEIERHNAGILLMMYRKFIVPGIRRRFQAWQYDYESDSEFEGFYSTVYNKLLYERDELVNMLLRREHNLTPNEVANVKRTLVEIAFMILLSSLALLEPDDDDDEAMLKLKEYTTYFAIRGISEISLYNFGLGDIRQFMLPISVGGSMRSFRTPSPIWSVFDKTFRATKYTGMAIIGSEDAYYQRDTDYSTIFGNFGEKGDSKAAAAWAKLFGLNGQLKSVETAKRMIEKDM